MEGEDTEARCDSGAGLGPGYLPERTGFCIVAVRELECTLQGGRGAAFLCFAAFQNRAGDAWP